MKLIEKAKKSLFSNELIKGSGLSLFFKVLGLLISFLFTSYITNSSGADAWGLFTLGFTILLISSMISRLGLDVTMVRLLPGYIKQGDVKKVNSTLITAAIIILVASSLASVIIFISSSLIATKVFGKIELTNSIQIMSLAIVPMCFMSFNSEVIRSYKKAGWYSFFQNMSISLFALVIVITISNFSDWQHNAVFAYMAACYLTAIFSFVILFKYIGKQQLSISNMVSAKRMVSISFPLLITGSLYLVMTWVDTIMLGILLTEESVGLYNVAAKLAKLLLIPLMAVNAIAAPKFSEMYAVKNIDGLKSISQFSSALIFILSTPLFILLILFSDQLLTLFGPGFTEAKFALFFICLGQFLNAFSGSVGTMMTMTGEQNIYNIVIIGNILVNGLLNYFLIPIYGIVGASIATCTSLALVNFIPFFLIRFKFGFYMFSIKALLDFVKKGTTRLRSKSIELKSEQT